MKKYEVQAIAPERSRLVMEYITQILSDDDKVNGDIEFNSAKIDKQMNCVLDIYVPSKNLEKHLDLGIDDNHYLVLYEQVLNDLLELLPSETMGVTKWFSVKSMGKYFSGVVVVNNLGSKININFRTTDPDFMKLINKYSKKYDEIVESLGNKEQGKIKK